MVSTVVTARRFPRRLSPASHPPFSEEYLQNLQFVRQFLAAYRPGSSKLNKYGVQRSSQ